MQQWSQPLPDGRTVHVATTSVDDGNFAVSEPALDGFDERRRAIIDAPWTWLRQVHGADIVSVNHAGEHAGAIADGALTLESNAPIAVTTADCAPVVLVASNGVAVVHAGWRGADAGIIGAAASALLEHGGTPVSALLGPCIQPAAYEFGAEQLDALVRTYGETVEGVTAAGTRALDMPSLVIELVGLAGWPTPPRPSCTSDARFFSHRTRGDLGRQTTVAWIREYAA